MTTWAYAIVEDDLFIAYHVFPEHDEIEHQIEACDCPCRPVNKTKGLTAAGQIVVDVSHRLVDEVVRDALTSLDANEDESA